LVKRQRIGDANPPSRAEREVSRSGRGCIAFLYEAFRKEARWFWKISCVVVKQLRAYPHGDIARELKPT